VTVFKFVLVYVSFGVLLMSLGYIETSGIGYLLTHLHSPKWRKSSLSWPILSLDILSEFAATNPKVRVRSFPHCCKSNRRGIWTRAWRRVN